MTLKSLRNMQNFDESKEEDKYSSQSMEWHMQMEKLMKL